MSSLRNVEKRNVSAITTQEEEFATRTATSATDDDDLDHDEQQPQEDNNNQNMVRSQQQQQQLVVNDHEDDDEDDRDVAENESLRHGPKQEGKSKYVEPGEAAATVTSSTIAHDSEVKDEVKGKMGDNHDTENENDGNNKDNSSSTNTQERRAMELNEAYEVLEDIRRCNLEVVCQECGIPQHEIDYHACTACLLEGVVTRRAASIRGRVHKFTKLKSHKVPAKMTTIKKLVEKREQQRLPPKCLTCGKPCCPKHASKTFHQQEGLTVCSECETVFQMNHVLDWISSSSSSRERLCKLDHIMDLYDRVTLLLKFAQPFMPELIATLESSKNRDNKINFGGSSVGVVSGILGVAAAATIVTPAGVPLLICSVMLGGMATASQSGTEMNAKFFSEPKQFANRIMALDAMAQSIMAIMNLIRDIVTQDCRHLNAGRRGWMLLDDDDDEEEDDGKNNKKYKKKNSMQTTKSTTTRRLRLTNRSTRRQEQQQQQQQGRVPHQTVLTATHTGKESVYYYCGLIEPGSMSRGMRQFSRSSLSALRMFRFAQVAGGVLAGATILLEAKNMAMTVKSIHDGSPCDKAREIRRIHETLPQMNTTQDLEQECLAYLEHLEERGLPSEHVLELMIQSREQEAKLVANMAKNVTGSTTATTTTTTIRQGRKQGGLVLLQEHAEESRRRSFLRRTRQRRCVKEQQVEENSRQDHHQEKERTVSSFSCSSSSMSSLSSSLVPPFVETPEAEINDNDNVITGGSSHEKEGEVSSTLKE